VSKRQTPIFPSHPSSLVDDMPAAVKPIPSHFMVDLLAPMRAFFNAWAARSGDSTEALKDGVSLISQRLSHQDEAGPNPEKQAASGQTPLERVDYSVATDANPSAACGTSDAPHHDPYVIELNLEVDEKQLDKANANQTGASTQSQESSDRQKKKLLLPLGWMLPAKARAVMETEIQKRLAPSPDLLDKPTHDARWFQDLQQTQLGRVLALLHRERPGGEINEQPRKDMGVAMAVAVAVGAGVSARVAVNPCETKVDSTAKEDTAPPKTSTVLCQPSCHRPCPCDGKPPHALAKVSRR
jgi:hypothetical protein